MPLITLYTATYNRAALLPRVYQSLRRQTSKDFLWLIIDDGSTDGTAELVRKWIAENDLFEIKYVYKENGGVHTARNLAHHICDTELMTKIDSDDWLVDTAVEKLSAIWRNRKNKEYGGIIARNVRPDGKNILHGFPQSLSEASIQEFAYKYRCSGDKFTVTRCDILKKLKDAPVYPGEKLVGESFFWMQIPNNIKFIISSEPITVVDYQSDGYSTTAYRNVFNNPRGFKDYYNVFIANSCYLAPRIMGHLGYIASCLILKDFKMLFHSSRKIETLLFLPLGIGWYFYILFRKMRFDRKMASCSSLSQRR